MFAEDEQREAILSRLRGVFNALEERMKSEWDLQYEGTLASETMIIEAKWRGPRLVTGQFLVLEIACDLDKLERALAVKSFDALAENLADHLSKRKISAIAELPDNMLDVAGWLKQIVVRELGRLDVPSEMVISKGNVPIL